MASPLGESGHPCRGAPSADGDGSLPPACGNGLDPPGGGTSPEAGPMGESGCVYWCAPFSLHRAGPREGACYGYGGVIVGEASHLWPVPPPADLSGAASPGEVLRYMRLTAGARLGPSRGGGHRQGKGGGLRGLADAVDHLWGPVRIRRSRLPPPGGDVGVTGDTSPRPDGATLQDLGTGSPLVYAPACGTRPTAAGWRSGG